MEANHRRRPNSRKQNTGAARHGIKHGMTVEDLKRLTQQRMTNSMKNIQLPVKTLQEQAKSSPLNPNARPMEPYKPQTPRTGMTVEELKRMTNARLAKQNTQKAVNLQKTVNLARNKLRETLCGDVNDDFLSGKTIGLEVPTFTSFRDSDSFFGSSNDSPKVLSPRGSQLRLVSGLFSNGEISLEERSKAKESIIKESMRNQTDALDDDLEKLEATLPSWSPPTSLKKTPSSTQASFFHERDYEKANNEQNKVVAPPPGLARRPSMTVPWQVAESVLITPQLSRKTIQEDAPEMAENNPAGGRRGSFGNAAQFFRFRRRSKSRLEIARDAEAASAAFNDDKSRMPGIHEDAYENTDSTDANAVSDSMSNFSSERSSAPSSPAPRSPMGPNGTKLQQVAVLARRGSVSAQDKTRIKDEIIQKSLGADLSLIGKIKIKMAGRLNTARKSIEKKEIDLAEVQAYGKKSVRPPPGFKQNANVPEKRGIARRPSLRKTEMLSLQDRLALAAKRVADSVSSSNTSEFQQAMAELDSLKAEASNAMNSN